MDSGCSSEGRVRPRRQLLPKDATGSASMDNPAPPQRSLRFERLFRPGIAWTRTGLFSRTSGSDSPGSGRVGSTNDASRSSSSTGSSWSARGGRRGMAFAPNETQRMMLSTVARLMDRFPPDYWKGLEDSEAYPEAFVREFEAQGFGGLLIPTEYGGAGRALSDAALLLEEIHARRGNAQPFPG